MSLTRVKRYTRLLNGLLLAAAVIFGASAGCGADPVGVCKKACVKTFTCIGGTQGQILDCQNNCQTNGGDTSLTNCTNMGPILDCQNGCVADSVACNNVLSCLGGCQKCVK